MFSDTTDQQLLASEKRVIELLARETHTAVVTVQETFLIAHAKLSAGARIKSYLPLLTRNTVRCILKAQNVSKDRVAPASAAGTNRAGIASAIP